VVEQPSGTVTLVFTDIAGSTRLLSALGEEGYLEELSLHRRLVRDAFGCRSGYEVDYQGDAFFYAFPDAASAVGAVQEVQQELAGGLVRLRVGIHTGEPGLDPPKYVGLDVHRAARIAAAGHGGQVLLSQTTRDLVDRDLRDLGEHRLKDLSAPQRLYQLLLPGLDADFPPLRTLYQTNLPVPATAFIGRERELAEVTELLSRDDARLVTLTGPGGCGKTRLALQAAGGLADHYVDGIWWVPLAALLDPALVLSTVATALGVRDEPHVPLEEQLRRELSGKQLLLLLDNAEHLLPDIVSDIVALRDIEGLLLIATSRERLRVQGEQTYPVPALQQVDAVDLFAARARQADPAFQPTGTVGALCDRLDGLPLAVELAAARTVVFSPQQLLERLGQRLDLLRADRDADPRHRTLRATIEWSHDLLSQPEQQLFRRMSVFAGGSTYDAAEHIARADADTLQSLLDKNLLRRRDTELGPRYWMLETIREFAREELRGMESAPGLERRHAEYILELGEAVGTASGAAREVELQRLVPELENLRAAMRWALRSDAHVALRLGWVAQSFQPTARELRLWPDEALSLPGDVPASARAQALHAAAHLASSSDDTARERELWQQALALYREIGNDAGVARTLAGLGMAAAHRGDYNVARDLCTESLNLYRALGDADGEWIVINNLGELERATSHYERATQLLEHAADLATENGDLEAAAMSLHGLADVALEQGKVKLASERYRQAISVGRELAGGRRTISWSLAGLASVAGAQGEPERAGLLWGAAESLAESLAWALPLQARGRYWGSIEKLERDRLDAAIAKGRTLTLEEALTFAVESG